MSDPRLDPAPGPLVRVLARLAASSLPLRGARPAAEEIRSLLVVRTDDRVGNALLTIPLARALQRALPQARVDLLLAARRALVAEGLPGLTVLRFDKRDAFANPLRFAKFLRRLRGRYEVVIDAAHWHAFSLTSALISRWAASRWLVGSARGPSFLYSAAVAPPAEGTPEAQAKLSLAAGLGLQLQAPAPETALGRGPSPVAGRFAALNPGARKADHRWPAARFGALARGLRERHGLRSVVFWGPGEEELARQAVLASAGAAELAPPTDLEQLAAAFRASALVVTNDTGPMHLAGACGARVLAVFLDGAQLRWAHPGPFFEAVVAPRDEEPALAAAARLLDSGGAPSEPASHLRST
jgi:ADP-heptose:LPS heptosyltransferase